MLKSYTSYQCQTKNYMYKTGKSLFGFKNSIYPLYLLFGVVNETACTGTYPKHKGKYIAKSSVAFVHHLRECTYISGSSSSLGTGSITNTSDVL